MARPRIKETIRALVRGIHREHIDWTAKEVAAELDRHFTKRNIKRTISVRSVQDIIHDYDSPATPESAAAKTRTVGLDQKWHIGLMESVGVTPEALPYVIMVQEWAEDAPDDFGRARILSVGQARWIGRLYQLIKWDRVKEKNVASVARFLWDWSTAYADREMIASLGGKGDTSALDKALREALRGKGPDKIITTSGTTIGFYRDRSFNVLAGDLVERMADDVKDGEG